jgi:hypothetical protein
MQKYLSFSETLQDKFITFSTHSFGAGQLADLNQTIYNLQKANQPISALIDCNY